MNDETTIVDKQQPTQTSKKKPLENGFKITNTKGEEKKYIGTDKVKVARADGYKVVETSWEQGRSIDSFKKMQDNQSGKKLVKNVENIENIEKFGKVGKAAIGALAIGGLTAAIFSDGGRQTNAQLYGQQPRY